MIFIHPWAGNLNMPLSITKHSLRSNLDTNISGKSNITEQYDENHPNSFKSLDQSPKDSSPKKKKKKSTFYRPSKRQKGKVSHSLKADIDDSDKDTDNTESPSIVKHSTTTFPIIDTTDKLEDIPQTDALSRLSSSYETLQKQYKLLLELRETKPEALLKQYKESAEARFQAADQLIARLGNDIHILEEQCKTIHQQSNEKSNLLQQNYQSSISLYGEMTGLEIISENSSKCEKYHCILRYGKSGFSFEFDLKRELDSSTIHYRPLTLPEKNVSNPPDFVYEEIEFEQSQLPIFYSKLYNWIITC